MTDSSEDTKVTPQIVRQISWVSFTVCALFSCVPVYFLMSDTILVGGSSTSQGERIIDRAEQPFEFYALTGFTILCAIGLWWGHRYLIRHLKRLAKEDAEKS